MVNENQTRELCLGQGFVTSKSFNLGNFLLDWNKFKHKICWRLFFCNKDDSSPVHPYRKSSGRPAPVGSGFESKLMENVYLSCEKEFFSKEFKVRAVEFKGNITFLEKLGIKELISNPDITILMQDKSKQLVLINTSEYDSKMETILQDKSQYVEAELDPSQHFKSKVLTWADEYLKSNDIDDITYKFIIDVNPKPGNACRLTKCHKENRPLRIIAQGYNKAVENLSHWVKDQLKPLANTCKYRLQDTNDVIFWLNSLNQKYAPFLLVCY